MRTLTLEGIYRNGFVEINDAVKFKGSQRGLVVFFDEHKTKRKLEHKFSFAKSLELKKIVKEI